MKPTISVVVTVYKVDKFLNKCIESLINQRCDNLDIILVDDGSPDACPEICDKYEKQYKNIRVIHKENGGAVSARKAGTNEATGDYICYVDGDDWVEENYFTCLSEAVEKYGTDIVIYGYTIAGVTKTKIQPNISFGVYNHMQIRERIIPIMMSSKPFYTPGVIPSMCTKVFKRKLIQNAQINVPDELTLGDDAAVSYPALLQAQSIAVIDNCGYMYRTNGDSMTRTYDKRLTSNALPLIHYLYEVMNESEFKTVLLSQLYDYVCFIFWGVFTNELKGNVSVSEALDKLQKIKSDYIIKTAVFRNTTPKKIKLAYKIISNKHILFGSILKLYWKR